MAHIFDSILRPYQKESHQGVYDLWDNYQRVMLTMPGGGGKTIIAASIIEREINQGKRVWFVAHRRELITQASERLFQHGIQSGIIMGSIKQNPYLLCQVGSIQTLDRRLDLLPPDVIMVDEGHRAYGPGYKRLFERYPKAKILGLTGTPFRASAKESLGDVYDAQISNILSSQLIKMGHTVPCDEWLPGGIVSKAFKVKKGPDGDEFDQRDLMRSFDQPSVYNTLINSYTKYAKGKRAIVFCCNVEHSIKTAQKFIEAGYKAAHIDGTTPKLIRDGIIADYKAGYIQILTNYGILAEGFDVPDTDCVILNMNTASAIKYFQACWRGSRPAPWKNKTHYTLIDMGDNFIRFGDPGQDIICDLNTNYVPSGQKEAPQKTCKCCKKSVRASAKVCTHCNTEFVKTIEEAQEEEMVKLTAIQKRYLAYRRLKLEHTYLLKDEEIEYFAEVRGFNERSWHRHGYDNTWAKKELARRAKGYKQLKLIDYKRANLKDMERMLQQAYHEKLAIPANLYQFVSETDNLITFKFLGKNE